MWLLNQTEIQKKNEINGGICNTTVLVSTTTYYFTEIRKWIYTLNILIYVCVRFIASRAYFKTYFLRYPQ